MGGPSVTENTLNVKNSIPPVDVYIVDAYYGRPARPFSARTMING